MARNIVIWSGGADSTYVLDHWAGASSEDHPVIALTVNEHPKLSKPFLERQRQARREYLVVAKKRGYHIKQQNVDVRGQFDWGLKVNIGDHGCPTAQLIMWLSALAQVVGDGDTVLFGYIRTDAFWHSRELFETAFDTLCKLKGVKATLRYELEWQYKADVLRMLNGARIPQRCWFSCEDVGKDGKACGHCSKCDEVADAKKHWRYKHDSPPISEGGRRVRT